MKISKFFTPPLSPTDREEIFRILGLERFPYVFVESAGKSILRAHVHRDGTRAPAFALPPGVPVIERCHEGHQLATESLSESVSFWEEIFPHPFRELGRWFREDNSGFRVEPRSLVPSLHQLWKALEALEARMREDEIGCLWLRRRTEGQWEELPLLCHYVRRRRVRLGNGWRWGDRERLAGLGELHRRGELTADELRNRLGGARSSFYSLDTSDYFLPTNPPVDALFESVQALLAATPPPPKAGEEPAPERLSRLPTETGRSPFEL